MTTPEFPGKIQRDRAYAVIVCQVLPDLGDAGDVYWELPFAACRSFVRRRKLSFHFSRPEQCLDSRRFWQLRDSSMSPRFSTSLFFGKVERRDRTSGRLTVPFNLGGQKRNMFIQTQSTSDPSSLMFYPGKPVMEVGTSDFPNARVAMSSPLAKALFGIDGISRVVFGSDVVTLTKSEEASWDILKPEIFAAIMDFYASGKPVFLNSEVSVTFNGHQIHEDDSETVAMIKELLETRIRPGVQDAGGDIEYQGFDFDTGIVKLRLQGAGWGCGSSSLKSGIENMLMHYISEVKGVQHEVDPEGGHCGACTACGIS